MKRPSLLLIMLIATPLAAATQLVACGSFPPPTERLNTTEGAIRGATEVGSLQIPRAALHLKLAQEQAEKARQLMQDGYNERADQALKRAQSDAELAIAVAKETQTVAKAEEAADKLQKAREEVMKSAGRKP